MKAKNVTGCQAIIRITLSSLCALSVSIGRYLRQAKHSAYLVSNFVTLSFHKESTDRLWSSHS